jgi:hypothetical protein
MDSMHFPIVFAEFFVGITAVINPRGNGAIEVFCASDVRIDLSGVESRRSSDLPIRIPVNAEK